MDSIKNCALIRELHVYGNHTCIGKKVKNRAQHMGLGSALIHQAELQAMYAGFKRIAVISGVGVRDYYRKQGYEVGEDEYMFKTLPDIFWYKLYTNYIEGFLEYTIFVLSIWLATSILLSIYVNI